MREELFVGLLILGGGLGSSGGGMLFGLLG